MVIVHLFQGILLFFLLAVLCLSEVILNLLVVILHLLQEMITLDDNRASGLVVAP